MINGKKLKWTVPIILALKDWFAFQLTIPWGQISVNPGQVLYQSILILGQSVVTNIIVYNHLVHKEAKKLGSNTTD